MVTVLFVGVTTGAILIALLAHNVGAKACNSQYVVGVSARATRTPPTINIAPNIQPVALIGLPQLNCRNGFSPIRLNDKAPRIWIQRPPKDVHSPRGEKDRRKSIRFHNSGDWIVTEID